MLHKSILPLLTTLLLIGCGSNNKVEQTQFTQIDDLLSETEFDCKSVLTDVANDLIGSKTHQLSLVKIPIVGDTTTTKTENDDSVITYLNTTDIISISGLLNYKDRPSHIRFDAYHINASNTDAHNSCVISYQLDYQLDSPCIGVREEAFKRWQPIGNLDNKTHQFVHMRHPNKKAYLTSINRDVQCLVSVQDIQSFTID